MIVDATPPKSAMKFIPCYVSATKCNCMKGNFTKVSESC